jgi:hypothetical protein
MGPHVIMSKLSLSSQNLARQAIHSWLEDKEKLSHLRFLESMPIILKQGTTISPK